MFNHYKTTCQTIHKTCFAISAGSVLVLSTLITPQIANASTIERFTISGELGSSPVYNPTFSNGSFTGFFDFDLDARYTTGISLFSTGTSTYDMVDWGVLFTASSGESFEFSPGETGDSGTIYLQPGYTNFPGFNTLTIAFNEDNGSADTASLDFSFNTDYDIVTNTTFTELLNADQNILDEFTSGTVDNIQSIDGGRTHLRTLFITPATAETVSPVPEASTLAMLGLGSLMVFGLARRNRKSPIVQTA